MVFKSKHDPAKEEAGNKIFTGQHDDEEVKAVFRQHFLIMRKALIVASVVLTIGALPLAIWPLAGWAWQVFFAGMILGILIFLYRFIGWYFTLFIVTDERIIQIKQKGLFDRRIVDIAHNRIQSVNYEIKGLQATLLQYGTVIIQTYVGDLVLRYIHKPKQVQELLVKTIRSIQPVGPPDLGEETGGISEEI